MSALRALVGTSLFSVVVARRAPTRSSSSTPPTCPSSSRPHSSPTSTSSRRHACAPRFLESEPPFPPRAQARMVRERARQEGKGRGCLSERTGL
eukprot:1414590-Pleurochrysis_carterae.AAC.1